MANIQRHAYLILAHNNFYNLERLLRLLDDERNDIFLHIDKKVKEFDFDRFRGYCKRAEVYYTRRLNVRWGHQSLVLAELELFRTAYDKGPYHYYHLISGADLPLKSQDAIHRFFANKTECFLHCNPEVTEWNRQRMDRYHFLVSPKTRLTRFLNDSLLRLQMICKVDRLRHCPMELRKGWEWGSLPHQAVRILIEQEKRIRRFTRFTLCSDEIYKQTFIAHYGCPMISEDLHLILWDSSDWNHPVTFRKQDMDMLQASEKLFARKFDEKVDKVIIDLVYDYVREKG